VGREADVTAPLVTVGYHTGNEPYRSLAGRLAAQLDALDLVHSIRELPYPGSWEAACRLKAEVCLQALHHFERVLYIDVDANVYRRPLLLESATAEFGVYRRPTDDLEHHDWRPGTLFFRRTPRSLALVQRWADLAQSAEWDGRGEDGPPLKQAWREVQPDTLWLPQSYCAKRHMEAPGRRIKDYPMTGTNAWADAPRWEPVVISHLMLRQHPEAVQLP
jgi:hypothetical protein